MLIRCYSSFLLNISPRNRRVPPTLPRFRALLFSDRLRHPTGLPRPRSLSRGSSWSGNDHVTHICYFRTLKRSKREWTCSFHYVLERKYLATLLINSWRYNCTWNACVAFGIMNGFVVLDCRRFLAAISAHSASKGSDGPVLGPCPIAADPRERALAWSGGAFRGLACPWEEDCTDGGTDPVMLPNHCSGFGNTALVETGWTWNNVNDPVKLLFKGMMQCKTLKKIRFLIAMFL